MTSGSPTGAIVDAESTRRTYLRHESEIRSVGQFCYLATFFSALGTLEFLLFAIGAIDPPPELRETMIPEVIRGLFLVATGLMLVHTVGLAALGYGLTHLQAWARWTVVALTALSLASSSGLGLALCFVRPAWGLSGLAIGGAIHGLILYPMLTPSSSVVFSPDYKDVIRATPGIRCRMHWLLKLFLGSIVASVVGFIAFLAAIYLRLVDW